MLTALHLGNFKAFGKTQKIPLKPITLVFGANSAGKSSLIHSFCLANEAMRTGEGSNPATPQISSSGSSPAGEDIRREAMRPGEGSTTKSNDLFDKTPARLRKRYASTGPNTNAVPRKRNRTQSTHGHKREIGTYDM